MTKNEAKIIEEQLNILEEKKLDAERIREGWTVSYCEAINNQIRGICLALDFMERIKYANDLIGYKRVWSVWKE